MHRTFASLLASLSLLAPTIASAQVFDMSDDRAMMTLGNDLYIAGNSLAINQNRPGDIFAAGSHVAIRGSVGEDIQAAGSDIEVHGSVGDDVRVAGGSVSLNGRVGGDVIVFGGDIHVSQDATIMGNLIVFGGQVLVEGYVRGNIYSRGGNVQLRGPVDGSVDVMAEELSVSSSIAGNVLISAKKLTIAESMRIGGNLNYWQPEGEMEIKSVRGTVTFDPDLRMKHAKKDVKAAGALMGIFGFMMLLFAALAIALFQFGTKTFFQESAKRLRAKPWWCLLTGFLYFAVMPVAILLLLVSMIGIPFGITLLFIFIISLMFAKVIAATVIMRYIELKRKLKWKPVAIYFGTLGIFVLLSIIVHIPLLGWIACMLSVFFTFGAVEMVKFERLKKVL